MPIATGHAEAMGHHGELVQGLFEDTGGYLKRPLVAVLFAHREGLVVESFRKALPPIEVISIDTMPGSTVDTLEFEPARYASAEIEAFRPIRSLLRTAINAADARLLGKAATASAHIN